MANTKTNREERFRKMLSEDNNICICGEKYDNNLKGGFVSNGITHIWCCTEQCADRTQNKLY